MSHPPTPRLRIVEIETFGRGGLTHYCYNLSCALADRGHDLTLVTSAAYELEGRTMPPTARVLKPIGRFTVPRQRSLSTQVLTWARRGEALVDACSVAALVRRLRPDVAHLHCTNPIALAYLMRLRPLGIPLVATAHVVSAHERSRLVDAIYRRIHRSSPFIIAHSEFDRNRLVEEFAIDPGRLAVIPHGEYGFFAGEGEPVDRHAARQGLGLEPRHEVALFFGYIREYKGLDVLLESWEPVVRARPEARLVVAGDPVRLEPARRGELESWAARLGVIHRFTYVPFDEVRRYFAAADVLVMPYRHVSQSGVLFLALALGLPVVATRVGGLPEMLVDGDNARLVPAESPGALGEALIQVLGDRDLRARLARGGRQVAERHTWPTIAGQTEAVFTRLVLDARAAGD